MRDPPSLKLWRTGALSGWASPLATRHSSLSPTLDIGLSSLRSLAVGAESVFGTIPANETFDPCVAATEDGWALDSCRSTASTCSTISSGPRLRLRPSRPLAQNLQP